MRVFFAVAFAIFLSATAAVADAIDGRWCNGAEQFTIEGPTITTPAGNRLQGNYDRHGFDYIVPDGEAGAGDRVVMALQSDHLLHLQRTPGGGATPGPVEQWRRCANIS